MMTRTENPQPRVTNASYNREDWQRGYRSLKQEFDYWIDDIEGEIPVELNGTLFRNGPGLLDIHDRPIHHPFDGDGMVCAIAFKDGKAHFRNRYVRTEGYLAEQKAGTILYRGVFGTDKPGGWLSNVFDLRIKNIANTNVIYWGGKLLALWEAAEPHRLDPATLDTLGLDYLDGVLRSGDAYGAHPWVDPASLHAEGEPCLLNFSIKPGLSSKITVFEFASTGQLIYQNSATVSGFCFIHDFVITPHYSVFFQNPVTFNPVPFLAGIRSAGECIQFHPERPTKIIVIPRGQSVEKPRIFETPSGFVFHHANAFEAADELIIDSVCYDSLPAVDPDADYRQTDFDALAPGQLWRFHLNLQAGTVQRNMIEARCCEFPTLHPAKVGRSHRYLYLAAAHAPVGNAPHQAIVKVDVESDHRQLWSAAPWGYVGEPIFVPRHVDDTQVVGDEDDGWVLTMVFDSTHDRSEMVILDAKTLQPIARLRLKHHVPYGLHGSFTRECFI